MYSPSPPSQSPVHTQPEAAVAIALPLPSSEQRVPTTSAKQRVLTHTSHPQPPCPLPSNSRTGSALPPAELTPPLTSASPLPSHDKLSLPRLNLAFDGSPLTYRTAKTGPKAIHWLQAETEEFDRLLESHTITPIHRDEQPIDRRGDTTYYNPQPKQKRDARGTAGGNTNQLQQDHRH